MSDSELVEGTYDDNQLEHLAKQVGGYLDLLDIEDECRDAFYFPLIGSYSDEFLIERMQCAKQFLRLSHLVTRKLWFVDDDPDVGQLYPDGKFDKNDKLLDIIFNWCTHKTITDEDVNYIIDLYKDRSYVVGYLPKPDTRKAPEPLEHTEGESDFA